ncbi:MAG TPA: hypothetical protein VIU83_02850 [Candidatus Deferrimicrobium sp.]
MIPARRSVFSPAFIGGLLLSLSVAAGAGAETGGPGVAVTKEVPHSKETLSEIRDREKTNPLPAKGDREMPSHKIPRAGKDNCERTE